MCNYVTLIIRNYNLAGFPCGDTCFPVTAVKASWHVVIAAIRLCMNANVTIQLDDLEL